jgi:hypothetical protein
MGGSHALVSGASLIVAEKIKKELKIYSAHLPPRAQPSATKEQTQPSFPGSNL